MKPGKIEAAILRDATASDGKLVVVNNHGPRTGPAIDRLEAKGWLSNRGNHWEITDAGRTALASI